MLVLSRRHDCGDGQLRLHAGAVQIRRRRLRVPQSRTRRRHLARVDARRHQVELGVVPAISRHRRRIAEGDQLRRLHGPLGAAHVRDGRTRVHRNGERRRSEKDVRADAGRAESRRHRLLDFAYAQPHHRRRASRCEPRRRLARSARHRQRDGRTERRHLRDCRRNRRPRSGTRARVFRSVEESRRRIARADHVRHVLGARCAGTVAAVLRPRRTKRQPPAVAWPFRRTRAP